jgi:primary-amine oxidase
MRRAWLCAPIVLAACSGAGSDSRPVVSSPPTTSVVGAATTVPSSTSTTGITGETTVPSVLTPEQEDLLEQITVAEPSHPLDALSAKEIENFRATIESDARFDIYAARFAYIGLTPPDKADVRGFTPGSPLTKRTISSVIVQGADVYDVVVDPATSTVISADLDPLADPTFLNAEFSAAINGAFGDPRMIAGLASRGTEPSQVQCLAFSPGSPRNDDELGRRMLRVSCFANDPANPQGFWNRPIEGLVATYDLDRKAVLSVLDDEAERSTPIPNGLTPTVPRPVPLAPPADQTAAVTAGVTVDGSTITWDRWSFRWRIDRRVGLVVNNASFNGALAGASEPVEVLYEASMSDMFVPYQDPDPAWSFRTFLDAAEFGMGTTITSLIEGADCPFGARLMPAVVPDELANTNVTRGAACVFVRAPSTPVWRHAGEAVEGTELVLRSVSTVGNYDYITDVVFGVDGSIQFDIAAAGIVLQRATAAQTDAEHATAGDDDHGELVAPGLVGVNHDHYLNFRLDLDVLGESNRLTVQRLVPEDLAAVGEGDAGRTSIWRTESETMAMEGPVIPANAATPDAERWLFESGDDGTGNRPAYLLDPMDSLTNPIAAVTDPGLLRAGWVTSPLWVTPYDVTQQYAGGRELPNGTNPGGLREWTQAGRNVQNTDLVAWYTVGFHHVVRSEDLPIMPVHRASFRLVPENVFAPSANPLFAPTPAG